MTLHVFDYPTFQGLFPALAAVNETQATAYFGLATAYLNPNDGCMLNGAALGAALNLMTAHLSQLGLAAAAGTPTGPIIGASEGSVSVSILPPPGKSAFDYWLSSTPYGQQLLALLSLRGAGGFLIGGSLERASFRKAGGVFL